MKKLWPRILIVLGILLILFGFPLAKWELSLLGVASFLFGIVIFLIGGVAAICQFAVRQHLIPHFLCGLAALVILGFGLNEYCFSLVYIRGASENSYQLWISALKPFTGPVYYVGSEGEFSYFRAGSIFPERYRAQTVKIKLPHIFPLGAEEPYRVTIEMVPKY